MIFGIYLLITLCSITIFYQLWQRERVVFEVDQRSRLKLKSELREDLFKGWPFVSLHQKREVRSKWFRVAHDLHIANFSHFDCLKKGADTVELIYKWIGTQLLTEYKTVDFVYNESYLALDIDPVIHELILSMVSCILCREGDLKELMLHHNNSKKRIELHFVMHNFDTLIALDDKQKAQVVHAKGRWLMDHGRLKIYLSNKIKYK